MTDATTQTVTPAVTPMAVTTPAGRPVRGARVTVIGAARSGVAAARLLARHGARVWLTDRGMAPDGLVATLESAGVASEFGGHSVRALDADFAVVSPGVPSTAPLVETLRAQGLPVYSEIEAASWFCRAPIVAITGTNGKTTTTSLTFDVFKKASEDTTEGPVDSERGGYRPRRVVVGGNIGYPFSDYADTLTADDLAVLEVSSFQLDHVTSFRPRVAVLLNITPDHLDRYAGDVERYAAAKYRIAAAMQPGDTVVVNLDDTRLAAFGARLADERGVAVVALSIERPLADLGAPFAGTAWVDGSGRIVLRLPSQPDEVLMPAADLALPGRHNLYNSLAAAIAARVLEVRCDVVRESLATFDGVPHRLESVRELDGVRYVNDSKATNVNAVWYALESFEREKIVLIAGGRDKGNDYATLRPLVRDKARAVVAIGESAAKVMDELGSSAPAAEAATSMEDAIRIARRLARPGDVVLLSPACASFDMFENYEDRGDTFKRLVLSL